MSSNSEITRNVPRGRTASPEARGGAIESWFAILVSSLVPLVGALFVPAPWSTSMHVLGALLCVWGLVLLVRHEMIERRQRDVTEG